MAAGSKGAKSKKAKKDQAQPTPSPSPLLDSEIDPGLVHPKWAPPVTKQAAAKDKSKAKKPESDGTAAPQQQAAAAKNKKNKQAAAAPEPFAFLITPYPNHNVLMPDTSHASRIDTNRPCILYFNRCLSDQMLSLHVESFSDQQQAVNLTFGITTCNTKMICDHKYHVKSFCTNNGRPCGGRSLICKLDRKVRGSEVISFKKVTEGINFLSDGTLVFQFRDTESIFKHKPAFPFIALNGDVESIRIVDPTEVTSTGRQSSLAKRLRKDSALSSQPDPESQPVTPAPTTTPSTPATFDAKAASDDEDDSFVQISSKRRKPSVAAEKRFTFLRTPYLDPEVVEITEKDRVVVRKSLDPSLLNPVYIGRELGLSQRRLVLQIEKVNHSILTNSCFDICVTTCDPETIKDFECHAFRRCWKFEGECGGHSSFFTILKCKTNSYPGTIVTLWKTPLGVEVGVGDWFKCIMIDGGGMLQNRPLYPFICMNGSATAIRIVEDPCPPAAAVAANIPRPVARHVEPARDLPVEAIPPPAVQAMNHFIVPPFASCNMLINNEMRTVTRYDFSGPRIAMLTQPLHVGDKLQFRVEDSFVIKKSTCAFKFCFTTCDLTTLEKMEAHGPAKCGDVTCPGHSLTQDISFADSGAVLTVERLSLCIAINVRKGAKTQDYVVSLAGLAQVQDLYPFIMLSGNANSITLLDESEVESPLPRPDYRIRDPIDGMIQARPSPTFERDPRSNVLQDFLLECHQVQGSPARSLPTSDPVWTPGDIGVYGDKITEFTSRVGQASNVSMQERLANILLKDRSTPSNWDSNSTDENEFQNMSREASLIEEEQEEEAQEADSSPQYSSLSPDDSPMPIPSSNLRANRTATLFIKRKWYNNCNVHFADNVITRLGSDSDPNYIFSSELRVNEMISFRVSGTDPRVSRGSLIFGVTTTPILKVDYSSLPVDGKSWSRHPDRGTKWFITHNLYNTVGISDGLTLVRRADGIALRLDAGGDEEEEDEVISGIDGASTVYPFFLLNGSVRSLTLETRVGPICFRDRVRLYLIFFYISMLNRCALQPF